LRPDPLKVDAVLAALLTVDALAGIWLGSDAAHHRIGASVTACAMTVAIAVRRRYPFGVGTLVPVVGALDHALWEAESVAHPIAEFCALYALAVWTPRRRFALGASIFVAAAVATSFLPGESFDHTTVLFILVVLVVTLLVRIIVGDRERRAELAERERDVAAREAVVEERARIARELHDAIAHNVSMVVMQAGAERRVLDNGGGSTRETLETIEQVGRGALTEMRRMIGMLRSDERDPLAPQPGLGDLPTLVGQVRDAGLPVELTVEGERLDLPVGVELSAYRIVQEALTNTLKHAGDARATVVVRYRPDSLELEIEDDGNGAGAAIASGGHGLVGMRERVALYGGRFDAGRRLGGGFAVCAVLPTR
jgi:signal transduction histidine kinase